jgi:hypothetical protein
MVEPVPAALLFEAIGDHGSTLFGRADDEARVRNSRPTLVLTRRPTADERGSKVTVMGSLVGEGIHRVRGVGAAAA